MDEKRTILDIFEETAITHGKRIAVRDPKGELTYGQLFENGQRMAAEIARFLRIDSSEKIQTGYPIAILAEKSCDELTAVLAAIYAGGFYVCINPEQTETRIRSILEVLQPELVIVSEDQDDKLAMTGYEGRKISMETLMNSVNQEGTTEGEMDVLRNIRKKIQNTNPLYGIFTSGSTGTPKCVLVEQQSVIDFIGHFVEIFGFTAEDVIGNQAPFDFDVSVKDIYSAWFTGASLLLIPREYFSTPPRLLDYICDNHVTNLTWAVSALCLVSGLKGFGYRVPTELKRVMFSGEVMPAKQLRIWQDNLPEARFVNLYGPSEITCNCTYYDVDYLVEKGEKLPLGKAFPGRKVLLLDDEDQVVTDTGVSGEICVLGESLAREYYHNPEQTEKHFVSYTDEDGNTQRMYRTGDLANWGKDGQMYFAGRKDFQIKHMGHRIELEEIELQLNALEGVNQSCCSYDAKRSRLTAYYTGEAEVASVHPMLKEKLPLYMIPAKFRHVKEFHLNKNGKIDRKELENLEVIE